MFSHGELFLTLAATVALFGPKDLPIVARAAGRLVGKAVGYVQSARGQIDDVMKRSQVDQVHKELQDTMAQLEAIRHEIRSGMSISNPGPLTRSISTPPPSGLRPGADGTFNTMPASTERIAVQRVVVKPVSIAPATSQQLPPNSTEGKDDIIVLPISAVSAGLLPPRTGSLPRGADLVLESMTERKVAFDTLEFFQRTDSTLGQR